MKHVQTLTKGTDGHYQIDVSHVDAANRLRLPLRTAQDVRRELAKIYREGKSGRRDVSDVSKLANILQILGRMIETGDLEARIERLEAAK